MRTLFGKSKVKGVGQDTALWRCLDHEMGLGPLGWHSSLEKKNHRHFLVHFLALFTD
jgi:hypothetical protein